MRGSRVVWDFGAFWTILNFVHFSWFAISRAKTKLTLSFHSRFPPNFEGNLTQLVCGWCENFGTFWSTLNFVQFSWSAVSRAKKNVALSFHQRLSPNFVGDMKRLGCGWCYILVHLGQGQIFVVCGCASAISAKISITLKVKNIPKIWGRSGTTWFWVVWFIGPFWTTLNLVHFSPSAKKVPSKSTYTTSYLKPDTSYRIPNHNHHTSNLVPHTSYLIL